MKTIMFEFEKKKMVETGSLKSLIKQDKISTNFLNYLAV